MFLISVSKGKIFWFQLVLDSEMEEISGLDAGHSEIVDPDEMDFLGFCGCTVTN